MFELLIIGLYKSKLREVNIFRFTTIIHVQKCDDLEYVSRRHGEANQYAKAINAVSKLALILASLR